MDIEALHKKYSEENRKIGIANREKIREEYYRSRERAEANHDREIAAIILAAAIVILFASRFLFF